jgi:acyl transferase domain-containing protein
MQHKNITIIGQSCLVPGALDVASFWESIIQQKISIKPLNGNYPSYPNNNSLKELNAVYGYIQHFDKIFNPHDYQTSAKTLLSLDPYYQWLLHAANTAIAKSKIDSKKFRVGAVIANLMLPSSTFCEYAHQTWLSTQTQPLIKNSNLEKFIQKSINPLNCFQSGFAANLLASNFNLCDEILTVDVACASVIYALKIARDILYENKADYMLVGGINRTDAILLIDAFIALKALSQSGKCLPLQQNADGIIIGEGAGFLVLCRHQDAIKHNHQIEGIIKGIGLSNDGASGGVLVPDHDGQMNAINQALHDADLDPEQISWIECHATGAKRGDRCEIESIKEAYQNKKLLDIGTLKGNIGHLMTASAMPAIIKVLNMFKHKLKPGSISTGSPIDALKNSQLKLCNTNKPWEDSHQKTFAAINAFGFGGNNAHLVLQNPSTAPKPRKTTSTLSEKIAITDIEVLTGSQSTYHEFVHALQYGQNTNKMLLEIMIDRNKLKIPPKDLQEMHAQQIAILYLAQQLASSLQKLDKDSTAIFIGSSCAPEIARFTLPAKLQLLLGESATKIKKDTPELIHTAGRLLGSLTSNICNNLNMQYDFKNIGINVAAEELSGIKALKIAVSQLRQKACNTALVGAVGLSCNPTRAKSAEKVLNAKRHPPGDAAVLLLAKRLTDAIKNKDKIYAVIDDQLRCDPSLTFGFDEDAICLTPLLGHAHSASGLLHVAAAISACQYGFIPRTTPGEIITWQPNSSIRSAEVNITALGGVSDSIIISSGEVS